MEVEMVDGLVQTADSCIQQQKGLPAQEEVHSTSRSWFQDATRGTRGRIRRQEVPLHRKCSHPRTYFDWCCKKDENAAYYHHPSGLPSFHQEVRTFREATHEHPRPLVTMLP